MSGVGAKPLELSEYSATFCSREAIREEWALALHRNFHDQVEVQFPSPLTDNRWKLVAQGWAGYIPVAPEFVVAIRPKTPIANLFRMLEWAYRLRSFEFLEGIAECDSVEEFYEQLASVLARRVLDRARRGLYGNYVPMNERLPYARGQLDMHAAVRRPWEASLPWRYEEHTTDVEDNRILAWTLLCVARSGLCTERVLPTVRQAYRVLQGAVLLTPCDAKACLGRLYHRLNEDYRPLHALCRFFLEHSGPRHQAGDRQMLPFLVNMERLFELFVAEWLKAHLPGRFSLKPQERVSIDPDAGLHFDIDLVLYDRETDRPLCVLDTKYKTSTTPASADVQQAIAYAETRGCGEAVLIYPTTLSQPLDTVAGEIRVRTLGFDIGGVLDVGGQAFVSSLLGSHAQVP